MKFTLSWLKQHLDTTATLDQIVDALTRIGLEVEGVENPGEKLAAFRIAKVLSAERHPQADKLQILSVDAGDGPLQVVCGAPNARAGLIGVFGAPGAYVPGLDVTLKLASIRGVESNGMMCSTRELELGEDHDGIIELPADAPIGTPYPDYAGLTDPVIDVAITPNRQDCMGVRGIARDLAAAGMGTLAPLIIPTSVTAAPAANPTPSVIPAEAGIHGAASANGEVDSCLRGNDGTGAGDGPDVATLDSDGCPAFFAQTVTGVTNGDSPDWMRRSLLAIGQKPISALVDITNYLMIDLGRPLHVYDRAKLSGGLVARKAKDGEQVVALNGKTYTLDASMTVIADDVAVHDIGGIMGGEHSGVSADTTDVLIECAYFDPDHIARTGQALTLTSDARSRFERGVDPAFLEDGLAIATALVLHICGGTASAVTRSGEAPSEPRVIHYDPRLSADLGGLHVAPERQARTLLSLGFTIGAIKSADAFSDALFSTIEGKWPVTVPSWRRDVDGPADLVEEVVRIEGIDSIPSTPLPRMPGVAKPTATPEQKLERRARRAAAARGLDEAVTWSFLSEAEAAPFGGGAWTLANPISEDLKVMRPSLLPGLLAATGRNLKRGQQSVRLFEIGRRYLADAERATLGVVLAGDRRPRGWREGKAASFDAYDAKAEALALLAALGAPVDNLQVMGEAGDAWHPGQSGTLRLGPKTVLASFGMLHPSVLKAFDLDGAVAAVEVYLDAIPPKRASGFARPAYTPPALQAVRRDFAFLVPAALATDTLVRAVKGADKAAIVSARVFDVFTGQGVEDGHKSVAVEIVLQPTAKSFTDEEIKAVADKVVAAAAKQGASLRG
ncbi:phenylalanine--tRNA ligase subunit beta [Sphingomonas aurantiaca]|uniref:phenylalanine--tRNA ligase subunit beta n=1 Tax=Sphingomonas TaxID=13687 RepID=UPI0006FB6018|nr:phenylalanine--tRNA ligase subunit beta [Sphingomonas sp. Leaf28]KQN08401.1 phenylalanine--tRNA ligase subunit beta [Sphingomonas sp. Leaf28]